MIYYVEDDKGIQELVLYTLRNSGFEAEGFDNGDQLFAALNHKRPRLILLDIMLPGEDGIAILGRLRHSAVTKKIPVIMVTAKGSEYDKIKGLDLGADDYISKPFGMMELVSRIRAVLRRSEDTGEDKIYAYENVKLNSDSRGVTVGGSSIELTFKEFELLKLLLKNTGRVVPREAILQNIWGSEAYDATRTVDVHIRTLRQKLGDSEGIIETIRGVGYRIGGGIV